MHPSVLDLNGVVGKVEWLLRRLIGDKVNLLAITTRDIGLVRVDPSQLEQVIINLAMNARDAMPDGGTLTLATTNIQLDPSFARAHVGAGTGPHVMLSITDSRAVTTEEIRSELFESFFTSEKPGEGGGTGVSSAYGIVRRCGGYIIADKASGRGIVFRIYLPRVIAEVGNQPSLGDSASAT
jgi:two-component system cell cycle sensor histidine kinase/response regulator CckA